MPVLCLASGLWVGGQFTAAMAMGTGNFPLVATLEPVGPVVPVCLHASDPILFLECSSRVYGFKAVRGGPFKRRPGTALLCGACGVCLDNSVDHYPLFLCKSGGLGPGVALVEGLLRFGG